MSGADSKRPQPVSVEDWDDEAQASVPGTRTTANVAVRRDFSAESSFPPLVLYKYDGTDSGYASKAPTVSSMASSSRRGGSDIKVDTTVHLERDRKPYAVSATPRGTDGLAPSRSTKEKDIREQPKQNKKPPFCHKKGICWVCDQYGLHFDPKDPPKDILIAKKDSSKVVRPALHTSQSASQEVKAPAPKHKVEEGSRPTPRRLSSNQTRPTSVYAAPHVQLAYPQHPPVHTVWPTMAPLPGVAYSSYPYAPATPISYMPAQPQHTYFEAQPVFDDYGPQQPTMSRRISMAHQERPVLEKRPSRTNTLERTASREHRPTMISRKSSKSIDDRNAMPPPPRPQQVTTANTARPRPPRAHTYHHNPSANRQVRYDETESESETESEDDTDPRALMAYKQTPASPRRPPSSYKQTAHQDVPERPQVMQKSQSYHGASNTIQMATTARTDMPRRRTTESSHHASVEQQEQIAEAYMRKRSSMTVSELTAENLKSIKHPSRRHVNDLQSESGSTASHVTHHSSSKDSSNGRGRIVTNGSALGHSKGTSMNINIDGINLNITGDGIQGGEGPPIKLDLGAMQISMNSRDKENIDYYKKPLKQIERAPSMSSRPSRRSLTQGSLVSTATNGQRREKDDQLAVDAARDNREYSRRDSYVDEDERQALREASQRSSRHASRNASSVRQVAEEPSSRPRPQSHRSSIDYTRQDVPVM